MNLFNDNNEMIDVPDVDLIFLDPPYNIKFKYADYKDDLTDKEYIKILSKYKNKKVCVLQYPEEFMKYVVPALGVPDKIITWVYNSNISRQHRTLGFYNVIPDLTKIKQPCKDPNDKRLKNKMVKSYDWWNINLKKGNAKKKEGNTHPCVLPDLLMEKIILSTTKEGDTIYDPFMGSGTTGVVCKKFNRKFIGCELSKEYFDIACKRIL